MVSIRVAKWAMKQWEAFPIPPGETVGECSEIFHHPKFTDASADERRTIMAQSAASKYQSELAYPWDHYFGMDLRPLLAGKRVLDLGCFTGGRGVAWIERYGLSHLYGVDVADVFIDAAREFAARRSAPAEFRVAFAESLPLEDGSVDAVLSFDVLEHVQDVPAALAECYRVLRPGGVCLLVFPGYFQPFEHHLALVTRCPGLQYFFSGQTLVQAYCQILAERGSAADWYRRESEKLKPWERGNTVNGTTLARFRKYLQQRPWRVRHFSRKPLGSIGRNASKRTIYKMLSVGLAPLARLPALEEIFLHRITCILEKPSDA